MKSLIILLIGALSFVSCNNISGNGNIKEEKRDVGDFRSLDASGSIDVEINAADNYSVTVEDDENLLPYVVTEVRDGVLHVHYKENYSVDDNHAKVIINAPSLDKINTSGSGDIEGNGVIKNAAELELHLSGSGNIDLQLDAPAIKVSGSGSGDIKLSGRTKNFDCKVSGSGDIECGNLQSEQTSVSISGSGNAHVFASVRLVARTSGSGDIYYSGSPSSTEVNSSGSGSVSPR